MTLTYEEKITYLANVVLVARADGKLSPKETEAIEKIQKTGARKTELNKAYKVAETQDYEINPVGHWADKIKNLEDIVYVSMVDGLMDEKEKRQILKFAKQINITQEQIKFIVGDVKNEIAFISSETTCPNCRAVIKSIAKFCPECGYSIQEVSEKKAVSVSYEIPKSGIAIKLFSEYGIPIAEIARNTGVSTSAVSKMVNKSINK